MGNKIMLKKLFFLLCIIPCFAKESAKKELLFLYQDKQTQYFGFKNRSGKIIIPARYDGVMGCSQGQPLFMPNKTNSAYNSYAFENMVAVYKNQNYWWIDRTGKTLYESFFFDNGPDYFHQGLSRIIESEKFGFINQHGVAIVKPQYDFASPFFLINDEGEIDFRAAQGMEDKGGYAFVAQGCWHSYPAGMKFPIAHYRRVPPDVYPEIVGGKWGVISTKGEIVVEITHDSSKEAFDALQEVVKEKA